MTDYPTGKRAQPSAYIRDGVLRLLGYATDATDDQVVSTVRKLAIAAIGRHQSLIDARVAVDMRIAGVLARIDRCAPARGLTEASWALIDLVGDRIPVHSDVADAPFAQRYYAALHGHVIAELVAGETRQERDAIDALQRSRGLLNDAMQTLAQITDGVL